MSSAWKLLPSPRLFPRGLGLLLSSALPQEEDSTGPACFHCGDGCGAVQGLGRQGMSVLKSKTKAEIGTCEELNVRCLGWSQKVHPEVRASGKSDQEQSGQDWVVKELAT